MSKVMTKKFWTEIFDNGEVVIEKDKDGNYRVSFFEDNHWKDEYVYVKFKNSVKKSELEDTNIVNTSLKEEDVALELDKYLKGHTPFSPLPTYFDNITNAAYIPKCCRNCSNHPSNGGTGVCHCTLPDYEQSSGWGNWKSTTTC